jgi:hypothetical protein
MLAQIRLLHLCAPAARGSSLSAVRRLRKIIQRQRSEGEEGRRATRGDSNAEGRLLPA